MFDIAQERLISFNQAAELLPTGMRPDFSTWWRWSRRGWRGIKLETVRVGKRRLTSVEAMQRFIAATTALEDGPVPVATARRPPKNNDSVKFLETAGILTPNQPPQQPQR